MLQLILLMLGLVSPDTSVNTQNTNEDNNQITIIQLANSDTSGETGTIPKK